MLAHKLQLTNYICYETRNETPIKVRVSQLDRAGEDHENHMDGVPRFEKVHGHYIHKN